MPDLRPQQDFGIKLRVGPSPFVFCFFIQFFRENQPHKMVKRRNNVRAKAARRARTITRKRHTSLARGVPLDKRGKAFHSNKGQLVIPKGMVLKSKIAQSVPLDMVKKKRDATNQTQTKTTNAKDKK